jgi:hypothetical protein
MDNRRREPASVTSVTQHVLRAPWTLRSRPTSPTPSRGTSSSTWDRSSSS